MPRVLYLDQIAERNCNCFRVPGACVLCAGEFDASFYFGLEFVRRLNVLAAPSMPSMPTLLTIVKDLPDDCDNRLRSVQRAVAPVPQAQRAADVASGLHQLLSD